MRERKEMRREERERGESDEMRREEERERGGERGEREREYRVRISSEGTPKGNVM